MIWEETTISFPKLIFAILINQPLSSPFFYTSLISQFFHQPKLPLPPKKTFSFPHASFHIFITSTEMLFLQKWESEDFSNLTNLIPINRAMALEGREEQEAVELLRADVRELTRKLTEAITATCQY